MLKLPLNDTLAQDFCDTYAKNVYEKLQKNIANGFKLNKKQIILSQRDKKFLKDTFTLEFIEKLILSKPKNLVECIEKLLFKKELHTKNQKLYKAIYSAFVNNGYNKIDKFKFIQDIGLKSCPYCNRNYIFTINSNKNIKPEIDHFYPKSLYPYLAVSYYNLIPSCPTCNGFGAKGAKDSFKDKLTNPYDIKDDDFKFTFDIISTAITNEKIDEKSIEIRLKDTLESNNEYFQIENLYKEHKDVVIELYHKAKLEYSHSYISSLQKDLKELDFTEEEIYKFITCGYVEDKDFHKRPLSKLIKDISEELELI